MSVIDDLIRTLGVVCPYIIDVFHEIPRWYPSILAVLHNGLQLIFWAVAAVFLANTVAFLYEHHRVTETPRPRGAVIIPIIHAAYVTVAFYAMIRILGHQQDIEILVFSNLPSNRDLLSKQLSLDQAFLTAVATKVTVIAILVALCRFTYTITLLDHGILNYADVLRPSGRKVVFEVVHRWANIVMFLCLEYRLHEFATGKEGVSLTFGEEVTRIGWIVFLFFSSLIVWCWIYRRACPNGTRVIGVEWMLQMVGGALLGLVLVLYDLRSGVAWFPRPYREKILVPIGIFAGGYVLCYLFWLVLRSLLVSQRRQKQEFFVMLRRMRRTSASAVEV